MQVAIGQNKELELALRGKYIIYLPEYSALSGIVVLTTRKITHLDTLVGYRFNSRLFYSA